jgi:hypothetical protein
MLLAATGGGMATLAKQCQREQYEAGRRPAEGLLMLPVALGLAVTFLALGYVAHVLWPRWPDIPVALDAPALPIVVSGVVFNVPPAAIRVPVQRRPGAQERLDLVYLWPALTPPEPTTNPSLEAQARSERRIFVTIGANGGRLTPVERLKMIYPRYLQPEPTAGPDGLTLMKFQDVSPYRGEDLAFDANAPGRFLARCSRDGSGSTRGTCLAERLIGEADITVRFPSDWIADWRSVANGIDRLVGQLRPSGS